MRHMIRWLGGMLLPAAPALAQTYTQTPPTGLQEKGGTVEWLMAAGFLVACLVVAFKPAKRSNLK